MNDVEKARIWRNRLGHLTSREQIELLEDALDYVLEKLESIEESGEQENYDMAALEKRSNNAWYVIHGERK